MLASNGKVYIPYGITVPGLANSNSAYPKYRARDDAQIKAAAKDWCANTIRLQVSQDNLVGASGSTYSKTFMNAIKAEVSLAESYGLVVVINAQTEVVGKERGPTSATGVFWKDLTGIYGHDGQVVFDLFNEPRVKAGTTARTWQIWQRGGTYHGKSYVGIQGLVSDVRADGAANLLWVEGPGWADTLAEVSSHRVSGGPLVYAIHHPVGAHNTAVWYTDFGYLVTKGIAPVVDGEWTNWASTGSECWPDAPRTVPVFLRYLQAHGIGMTVWQLIKGVMIESPSYTDPTRLRSSWKCTNGLDQGAGYLVMSWYKRQNAA